MGGEIEFPELVIQCIQSLLTGKEAARTTILSKSWHHAWLTRPNLNLDDKCFDEREDHVYVCAGVEFSKYAKKTIKRYEQSNLKIERFNLCMKISCYASDELANKLIAKAVRKLGATHISLQLYRPYHYRPNGEGGHFVLPHEVLFVADNLVELSVGGCEIKLDGIEINCSNLKSLHLQGVATTVDALSNIISCCPSIEYLSLSYIDFDYQKKKPVGGPGSVRRRPVGLMNTNLHRLRCLVLCYVSFKTLFPGDLLSKFPFLADLTLNLNPWDEEGNKVKISDGDVQISNCSLEHIKIELVKEDSWRRRLRQCVRLKVRLDVPSIRKFTFEGGDVIPELSLVSTPAREEWESHVSIARYGHLTAFWFRKLNEFLTQLRQSKIHLSLCVQSTESFDFMVGDVESIIRKHELENLTIDVENLPSFICYALFDGLFRLCRPKLITQTHTQKNEEVWEYEEYEEEVPERKTNTGLLCQVLDQGIHFKVSDPRQFMYGLNDLEEAYAQIFDDGAMGWRPPIPLMSLLESQHQQRRVRLLLKWKP